MHGFYEAGTSQLTRLALDPVSPESDPGNSEHVHHRTVSGEYLDMDQEAAEGENTKGANILPRPTKEEYDSHQLNHWPYREWCPFCVKGRGMSNKHQRRKGEASTVPVVRMDYMFMSEASGKEDKYIGI